MFEYEEAIVEYAQALEDFIARHELPAKWFAHADHLAIKCADGPHYEYTVEDLLADASQASEVTLQDRRLATFHLTSAQKVGNLCSVDWLEIMEPRPARIGKDITGLEHTEFYYPDFEELVNTLSAKGIVFEQQSNTGHAWISVILNSQGQELKLNNRPLSDIVAEELENGTAHFL